MQKSIKRLVKVQRESDLYEMVDDGKLTLAFTFVLIHEGIIYYIT